MPSKSCYGPTVISRTWRRTAALTTALAMTAAMQTSLLAPSASAADPAPFVLVGTSDVYDSNLVQTVLEPGFEKAYPQYDLQYVSRGTGAAIAYAQSGAASAMIVHAAALENQFVADGYSLEKYGRAIFWGDFVLLGPADDPAGVLDGDSTFDIRHAFEKVAAAGEAGEANFVSRGGTPGTTVQEHAIWAETTGVDTCEVSAVNGGGTTPSTTSGACQNPVALPDWYHSTGLTQAPNVLNGDVCNYDGGGCYVFTDRGTFQYLQSTGAINSLRILTRPDPSGDAALSNLLVNSFHAYGIDPEAFSSPDVQINTKAATAFLNWITSPATQAAVGRFLSKETGGDPPFLPSAAPNLKITSKLPAKIKPGKAITVTGALRNEVPGTPALANATVRLMARPYAAPGAAPRQVATARTNAAGRFSVSVKPRTSQIYSIKVDGITQIVNSDLNPVFGDLLQPTGAEAGATKVTGTPKVTRTVVKGKRVTLKGKLSPKVTGSKARVEVWAAKPGKKLRKVRTVKLKNGATSFTATFKRGKGTWKYQVRYVNRGVIEPGTTATKRVRIR